MISSTSQWAEGGEQRGTISLFFPPLGGEEIAKRVGGGSGRCLSINGSLGDRAAANEATDMQMALMDRVIMAHQTSFIRMLADMLIGLMTCLMAECNRLERRIDQLARRMWRTNPSVRFQSLIELFKKTNKRNKRILEMLFRNKMEAADRSVG